MGGWKNEGNELIVPNLVGIQVQRAVKFQALHFIDIFSSISQNLPGPLCDMRQSPDPGVLFYLRV